MTVPMLPGPFWLVGCGNMAGTMLSRWLATGVDPKQISVIRPSGGAVAGGVRVLTAYPEDEVPAIVMLGMKPLQLAEAAPTLAPILDVGTILISILAGVEMCTLRAYFPTPRAIIKAMPNLAAQVGKGVTNLYSDSTDTPVRDLVEAFMAALGTAEWFEDEPSFQMAGILTGAGPAFVFRFLEALIGGAEAMGLSQKQAARLTYAMAEGAATLAAASGAELAALTKCVASPGGTTHAGLDVLNAHEALDQLIQKTLEAGLRRAQEIAQAVRTS